MVFNPPTFMSCMTLVPEIPLSGMGTRVLQTTWDGCSFYIPAASFIFNKVLLRFTATTGTPTASMLFYQPNTDVGYPFKLVGSITSFSPVIGNMELPVDQQISQFCTGPIFCLFGRTSATGTATIRTYGVQSIDLLNQNVDSSYYLTTFTTSISTSAPPASFSPLPTPTGSAITSTANISPIIRIRAV